MANEFMSKRVANASVTLPGSATTTNTSITIPSGSVVTAIYVNNSGALATAGNFTVLVDTVAQMTAAAAVLTADVVTRYTANATAKTIATNNGGKIGITTSAATTGTISVIVEYLVP